MKLHDEIRKIAKERFVAPARFGHRSEFSIAIKDLMDESKVRGISPVQRVPAFCNSIQTRAFLEENGLEVTKVEGPGSKVSTTVVVNYRFTTGTTADESRERESPEGRISRLAESLRGLMKEEIAAHGGTKGFLRWVRSDEDAK